MIEDALKSSRTLHRLIMTVSLVTIVFALSINLPMNKANQKQIIDELISTDFSSYSDFVELKVEEKRQAILVPLAKKFENELENQNHLTFGLSTLAQEFSKPIHTGRLLTEELLIKEISNASIVALNALNGLSLSADVQILVPRIDGLLQEIEEFLSENPQAGRRVDTIRLTIGDFEFLGESFLPGKETTVGIYFELLDAVRTGGAPAFNANFIADIVEVEDSSFITWLRMQNINEKLVSIDNNEVVFAPDLQSAQKGFTNEKLGVLSLRLEDDISKSSPASQSVSILGTSVPGALAIFASPLILIALSYYFSAHTGHLSRIVSKDRERFETFSWLPLSVHSLGLLECLSSAIVLPIFSIGLLFFRLSAFGNLSVLQISCLVIAAASVCLFGLVTLKNIGAIRRELAKPPSQPPT